MVFIFFFDQIWVNPIQVGGGPYGPADFDFEF